MKKICIFLTFSKEIDNYSNIIKFFSKEKIVLCLSDFDKTEHSILKKYCENELINYINFSEVLNKKIKFDILITQNFELRTFDKFSIKHFIKFILKKLLFKKKNYPKPVIKIDFKKISNKIFKFPKGLDASNFELKKKSYQKFDKIFCHSNYDKKRLNDIGFNNTYILGFPRYNKNDLENKNSLVDEFNIRPNEKIIFWLPTRLDRAKNKDSNLLLWIKLLGKIAKEYKFICRPHPDLVNKKLIKILKKNNFLVDIKKNRRLVEIYKSSSYIFCDYGETIFSSLLFGKKLILLNYNLDVDPSFTNNNLLDISIRKYCPNFSINNDNTYEKIINLISNDKSWEYFLEKRKTVLREILPQKKQEYYNEFFVNMINKELDNDN